MTATKYWFSFNSFLDTIIEQARVVCIYFSDRIACTGFRIFYVILAHVGIDRWSPSCIKSIRVKIHSSSVSSSIIKSVLGRIKPVHVSSLGRIESFGIPFCVEPPRFRIAIRRIIIVWIPIRNDTLSWD